jgi:hypothetical protein
MRNSHKILVRNPEGKRPLGRSGNGWDGNIKSHFKEMRCNDVDWIHLAQDKFQSWALVNTLVNQWLASLNSLIS